ncbi:hypothetical protein ELH84_02995 [Rhizobium ruizarguesonis]|nr:hypothetical protein ELH84_02995 [Rhizobium ruizarguesonis]
MRLSPFAPRAGRRCRQADEGLVQSLPLEERLSNAGIAAAAALFKRHAEQDSRQRLSHGPGRSL